VLGVNYSGGLKIQGVPVLVGAFCHCPAIHMRDSFKNVQLLGCVPLPGMVGYGATVWDPPPTHPPRITEHGAPGGSDPPPQNYGTWWPGGVRPTPPELGNMVPRGGPTYPPRIMEHAYLYYGGTVTFVSMYQVRARAEGIIY
jgi:hypothetical protein